MISSAEIAVNYLRQHKNKRLETYHTTSTTETAAQCCIQCFVDENCATVNYKAASSECQMSASSASISGHLVPSTGWSLYAHLGTYFLFYIRFQLIKKKTTKN